MQYACDAYNDDKVFETSVNTFTQVIRYLIAQLYFDSGLQSNYTLASRMTLLRALNWVSTERTR